MNTTWHERLLVVDDGSALRAMEHPGTSLPVVFLHDLDADGSYWQPVIDALLSRDPQLHLVVLDLRGHGGSACTGETSRRRLVKDLRRWIKEVKGGAPLLVGHGWGADIALACDDAAAVIAVNPLLGRDPAPYEGDVERPAGMRGASDAALLEACRIGAVSAKPLRRTRRDPSCLLVLADPLDLGSPTLPELRDVAAEEVLWQDGSRHLPQEYPVGIASLVLSWTEEA